MMKKSATTSKLVDNDHHSTASNQQTNKRLATTDNENNKKLKRTNSVSNEESSQSHENLENTFSLNQFYLDKFLIILSSLLKYHQCLFDENELILFDKFQTLSGLFRFNNL